MEGSEFIFDSFQTMYCKCHKVNSRRGGSCIDSSDFQIGKRKKNKNGTINPICFQYVVTVALNYQEIKWNPKRVSNVKPFINKYKWKGTNYPSILDD